LGGKIDFKTGPQAVLTKDVIMPLMRAGSKLLYYAHVPKCAGSALEHYLAARFGSLAFVDTAYLSQPHPWTHTSPQHMDRHALARLFPAGFIDASFAVVRHPTARIISAWHFQLEQEKTVPQGMTFSDWLTDLPLQWAQEPYAYDNHTRPMSQIVPAEAAVFYLEHGLEAIIPWLNTTLGDTTGPAEIRQVNARGAKTKAPAKISPSAGDLALIGDIFAQDFERFGYRLETPDAPQTSGHPCPIPGEPEQPKTMGLGARAAQLMGKIRNRL